MIPLQLTLKGLYSYQDLTQINFEPLVEARLFGIFGAVGSGKSAILEAIMFVLFDRTTRLNKAGDDRYYNMMNLQSRELIIDFIFKGGPNNQNKYRFYFRARRHPKDFAKVEVKDRSYYQWSKDDWIPLNDPKVLGMTYENFMQTVIIPQGKFREFIDQKPAARTQMLKELFHLEEYELSPQAYLLLHETKDRLTFVEGQLSQYQELSIEGLQKMQEQMAALEERVATGNAKTSELSAREAAMEALNKKVVQLREAGEALRSLQDDQPFYQAKQHQLHRYEKAGRLFQSKIDLQRDYLEELKSKRQQLSAWEQNIQRLKKERKDLETRRELAGRELKNKEQWQQETADLELLIEIQSQQLEYQSISQEWQKMHTQTNRLQEKEKTLAADISQVEKKVKHYSQAQGSYQQWLSASRWWEREQELEDRKMHFQQEWQEIDLEVQAMVRQRRMLAVNEASLANVTLEIDQLQKQLQALKIREDWGVHAQHLQEGKPCPLCGSLHHPKVMHSGQQPSELISLQEKLRKLQREEEGLRKKLEEYKILNHSIKLKSQQSDKTEKKLQEVSALMAEHRNTFPVEGLQEQRPENWESILDQKKQEAHQGQRSQDRLNRLQESYRQLNEKLSLASKDLHEVGRLREQHKGAMDQKLKSVRSLSYDQYMDKSASELQSLLKIRRQKIKQVETDFEEASSKLQETIQKLTRQQTMWESLHQQVNEMLVKTKDLERELMDLCKKETFKNLAEIQRILALKLDVEQERGEINRYQENLSLAKIKLRELQKAIGKQTYSEHEHRELKDELETNLLELKTNQQELAGLQHSFEEKQQQLQHKKELEEKQKKLALRKQHIQEISNLLRGNGFINFISSTYLHNLCKAANNRFLKLTGNRLSLELSEHNDFMVRDYLNEGKLRLLKTLSGGQIFQASLCLALSLAENVKSFNRADQSFFFLDEGFGSLDKSSMQVVIETLKSLQQENRIVGIISHVEELQHEIVVYLSVKQHGEKGSRVIPSWES